MENTLKPQGMSLEQYISLVREALTVQDVTKKKFSYTLQQGSTESSIKFVWNIRLGEDLNFAMKGALELEKEQDTRPIKQAMFDHLIEKVTHMDQENRELKKMNNNLTLQRTEAIAQFDRLMIERQCIETELLAKFVDVLNEKKKKIRALKDEMKSLSHGNTGTSLKNDKEDNDKEEEEQEKHPLSNQQQTFDEISSLPSTSSLSLSTATFNLQAVPTPTIELLKDDNDSTVFGIPVRKSTELEVKLFCNRNLQTTYLKILSIMILLNLPL